MYRDQISRRALKPPMGWNSWDCFGTNVTEEEVKENAIFIANNLKQFGWQYVVVDLGWYSTEINNHNYKNKNIPQHIDNYGRLIPDTKRFPSAANGKGFKELSDFVHRLGLKFGIHIMRGIPVQAVDSKSPIKGTNTTADKISYDRERCPWFNSLRTLDFTKDGSQKYYDSIFELYAEWGVDYVKADDINAWSEVNRSNGSPTGEGSPYRIDDVEGMAKAINNCGRDIVFSISPGGPETTIINHLRNHTNLWRISADFWDEWGSLKAQMNRCSIWAPFVSKGHWPDADMLPLGDLPRGESGGTNRVSNFTREEHYTVMSLWCMFRSPLMFGGNLPKTDKFTIDLISNDEILEINQNSYNNRPIHENEEEKIWIAENEKGIYIAFFNTTEKVREISLELEKINLSGSYNHRDLWAKENLGKIKNTLTKKIAPHGARIYLIFN
jgi:hypothetical protein